MQKADLDYAKQLISECNGTHPTEFVCAKSQLACANALVAIAGSLARIEAVMRDGSAS